MTEVESMKPTISRWITVGEAGFEPAECPFAGERERKEKARSRLVLPRDRRTASYGLKRAGMAAWCRVTAHGRPMISMLLAMALALGCGARTGLDDLVPEAHADEVKSCTCSPPPPTIIKARCDHREASEPDQWFATVSIPGKTVQQLSTAAVTLCRTDVPWEEPGGRLYACKRVAEWYVRDGEIAVPCPDAYSVEPPYEVTVTVP